MRGSALDGVSNMMEGKEMERLRATLNEQLRQTRDRVKLELLEQKEALKQSEKSREDAGVRLHAAQSQLTALQTDLRSVDERYETVSEKREISQKKLAEIKAKHAARLDEAESLHKEATDRREELEALREKIRLTKQYNEEIKSEVAATRTMASKTKDDVKSRAKVKLEQDLYIDNLTRQATRLEDEIAATESQLAAQKEQSADADEMIRETSAAIDKLASEQKRLVQQVCDNPIRCGAWAQRTTHCIRTRFISVEVKRRRTRSTRPGACGGDEGPEKDQGLEQGVGPRGRSAGKGRRISTRKQQADGARSQQARL